MVIEIEKCLVMCIGVYVIGMVCEVWKFGCYSGWLLFIFPGFLAPQAKIFPMPYVPTKAPLQPYKSPHDVVCK